MRTLIFGATLLLVPNLLEACLGGAGTGRCWNNVGLSLGKTPPWNLWTRNDTFNPWNNRPLNPGNEREEKMDDFEFLEILAFALCEEDDDIGLTWKEVSNCIVSYINHLQIPKH